MATTQSAAFGESSPPRRSPILNLGSSRSPLRTMQREEHPRHMIPPYLPHSPLSPPSSLISPIPPYLPYPPFPTSDLATKESSHHLGTTPTPIRTQEPTKEPRHNKTKHPPNSKPQLPTSPESTPANGPRHVRPPRSPPPLALSCARNLAPVRGSALTRSFDPPAPRRGSRLSAPGLISL